MAHPSLTIGTYLAACVLCSALRRTSLVLHLTVFFVRQLAILFGTVYSARHALYPHQHINLNPVVEHLPYPPFAFRFRQGLAPVFVDPESGLFGESGGVVGAKSGLVTLGARGDSYYEYLLKQWLFSNKE